MSYLFSEIVQHLLYIERHKLKDWFVYVDRYLEVSIRNIFISEYYSKTKLIIIHDLSRFLRAINKRDVVDDDFKGYKYVYSGYSVKINDLHDLILAKTKIEGMILDDKEKELRKRRDEVIAYKREKSKPKTQVTREDDSLFMNHIFNSSSYQFNHNQQPTYPIHCVDQHHQEQPSYPIHCVDQHHTEQPTYTEQPSYPQHCYEQPPSYDQPDTSSYQSYDQ